VTEHLTEGLKNGLPTSIVGRQVLHFAKVSSTMDVAREHARRGAEDGLVVLADEQTAGRGRFRRRWVTHPESSIALSLVLRPPAQHLPALSMMSALATIAAVTEATGLQADIKWPNDVMIKGKKVGGILVESERGSSSEAMAIVGIGINVNFDVSEYPEIAESATSLSTELGSEISRTALVRTLLIELDRYYHALLQGQPMREEWARCLSTLGQSVRVTSGESVEEGIAEAVGDQGQLILRRADGSLKELLGGEVSLRSNKS
jgi:BirA family biotin operon repressor/biotin-[acetyl-CoA-carboxylase] ligase